MENSPIEVVDGEATMVNDRVQTMLRRSRSTALKAMLLATSALLVVGWVRSGAVDLRLAALLAVGLGTDLAAQLYIQWEQRR